MGGETQGARLEGIVIDRRPVGEWKNHKELHIGLMKTVVEDAKCRRYSGREVKGGQQKG